MVKPKSLTFDFSLNSVLSEFMREPLNTEAEAMTGFSKPELDFIQFHKNEDVNELMLKASRYKGLDVRKMAGQILSRQKALKKLPEWSEHEALIFPPALSVEQCSSEATARYKASLMNGDRLIDITGGMGVDCFYLSRKFNSVICFEQQKEVAATASYNFKVLQASNILVIAAHSLERLQADPWKADWLYADPARRDANNDKVVLLADCTPDIVPNLPLLLRAAPELLLKTSPLLDIDRAVGELQYVEEVHVVGFEQECKELLFKLNARHQHKETSIKAVIINAAGELLFRLDFTREEERSLTISYSAPLSYLYEPHPALLKAGAFKVLCSRFGVHKLAGNSHLYTSETYQTDFPGRAFEITASCKPDSKQIASYLTDNKANLTIRNFPAKIQELRKKWRLKEGGDVYLFATTLSDNRKTVLITRKIPKSRA